MASSVPSQTERQETLSVLRCMQESSQRADAKYDAVQKYLHYLPHTKL